MLNIYSEKMKIFSYAFMIGLLITPLLASAQKAIQVDTGESRINWIAKKPTGEHRGYLKLSGGELLVDSNQIKGGSFIIDMKSVTDVDISDNTTNDKITRDLKSSKIFDINIRLPNLLSPASGNLTIRIKKSGNPRTRLRENSPSKA
jgi:hypothetical protein